MRKEELKQLEEDIVNFAYAYGTIDINLIKANIPEAKSYSQDEVEALIFMEYKGDIAKYEEESFLDEEIEDKE